MRYKTEGHLLRPGIARARKPMRDFFGKIVAKPVMYASLICILNAAVPQPAYPHFQLSGQNATYSITDSTQKKDAPVAWPKAEEREHALLRLHEMGLIALGGLSALVVAYYMLKNSRKNKKRREENPERVTYDDDKNMPPVA